jgi:hypothetical protein
VVRLEPSKAAQLRQSGVAIVDEAPERIRLRRVGG